MAEPVVIGFGVNKWVKDTDTKMIYLSNTSAINNTGQDMETAAAGAALSGYTIPVGKKFVLLRVQVMVYSTTAKEGVIINERYGGTNYFKIRHALNNSTEVRPCLTAAVPFLWYACSSLNALVLAWLSSRNKLLS